MSRSRYFRPRWLPAGLVCVGIAAGLWTLSASVASRAFDLEGPGAQDRQVTRMVTLLMQQEHMSQKPFDDEISKRGMDLFLKTFDPMKMYFYQSDIDAFNESRTQLDDMIKKGDISFAYTVHGKFLERLDERIKVIDELLASDANFEFASEEEMITDADMATYAESAEDAKDKWRKRLKYDLLVLKSAEGKEKLEGQAAREKLSKRYHSFAKRMHQTKADDLLELYLTSITSAFDPHTTYMSQSSLDNFEIQMRLKLEGIGASLTVVDGNTVVNKVIKNGAADKDGRLKPEDRIVSVGQGENGEMVDVVDMNLNDVVHLIRGKAGTVVRLGVMPNASNELQIYNITRAKIELKDEEARGEIIELGPKRGGGVYRIGYIDLPSFYMDMDAARAGVEDFKSTTTDMKAILEDFNKQSVDVVLLDLRQNGGGSLTEAINCTGLFIDQGPVVQVKDPDGNVQHYDDLEKGMSWKGPLVVMTSKFSASASEILAGAIQDYNRGLIIGDESTHGKGTVQSLLDLGERLIRVPVPNPPKLGALKITMQQFYRPNGDSTQKRGVLSDVVLPSLTNYMDLGEAELDYALDFDRVQSSRYSKYSMLPADVLRKLREQTLARQRESEDFQKLLKNIERYQEQKSKKTISLNEEKFFARRAEFDADEEDKKLFDEQENKDDSVVAKRTFYLNEALAITVDYLNLLDPHKLAQAN
jgi:carboxyl-terminal processing protease